MDERERRIRERAHALWEEEGRPEGRHDAHWERARQEIDGPADAGEGPLGAKAPNAPKTAKRQRRSGGAAPGDKDRTRAKSDEGGDEEGATKKKRKKK
ncbi:DUF2934 domain-containing protein [Lutibaculum baratangense]|nr:DUF2934 domain-containing protein [Lutibaculum baratangense]